MTEQWIVDLQEHVAATVTASALSQGILTLGGLRTALALLPGDMPVVLDRGAAPADLHSYRGYYERLSIGSDRARDDYETAVRRNMAHPDYDPDPALREVTIAEPVTVAEFLKALDLANGDYFEGYKGGNYLMGPGTFMHVAEYGCTGRCVTSVSTDGIRVVIETAEEVWR